MLLCRICAKIATVSPWRTTCGGFKLERSTAVGGAQSGVKILKESAQQVTGGTNRCQCQSGKRVQCACGTARSV